MADIVYIDVANGLTVAEPMSPPVFTAPFQGVNIDYVFTQDFWQLKANKVSLALNTPHPDYADFLLVSEGPEQDLGGLVVKWTRTYAKVPATYDQPGTVGYNFIGFVGNLVSNSEGTSVAGTKGRFRFQNVVAARIQYDYFLISSVAYPTISDVPILQEQKYYSTDPIQVGVYTDYLTDADGLLSATVPSRSDYDGWLADPPSNQIVAQPSQLRRWLGNIIERQTPYILPE